MPLMLGISIFAWNSHQRNSLGSDHIFNALRYRFRYFLLYDYTILLIIEHLAIMESNMIDKQKARFCCIGSGFCGTIWAHPERGEAYKRQNAGPERSLPNDSYMHQRALAGFRALSSMQNPQFQISRCYRFIRATARGWWDQNLSSFPAGFAPCDTTYFQRIPPFLEATRRLLIDKYCPTVVYQGCVERC